MTKVFNSLSILCLILFFSSVGLAGGDDTSVLQAELDMVLMEEFNPCFDQLEGDINDDSNITSVIKLSGLGAFNQGDEIMSSSNVKAIVESYDPKTNQLTYYQTAKTGFKSFSIGERLVGKSSDVLTIEELVLDFVVPCSDLIVSIEEDPEQMIFIFADSEAAIKARLAAAEMMAEIEAEMARAASLKAFQDKLAADKAAAAKSTAAYQSKLARDAEMAARMEELAIEQELATFEAKLAAEQAAAEMMAEIEAEMARAASLKAFQDKLAADKAAAAAATAAYRDALLEAELAAFEAQVAAEEAAAEMMAEIEAEMARAASLKAFQDKLAADKAAAAKSTAAYQSKLARDAEMAARMEELAIEQELATFEAKLAAEQAAAEMMAEIEAEMARAASLKAFQDKLAADKAAAAAATAAYRDALLEAELAAFEAQVAAEEAAAEMMAEIEAEMARAASLKAFLKKLEEEKAAASSSTAAYQAKLAYDKRVTKIMDDLLVELDDFNLAGEYKSSISDELIKEATAKLEEEAFVGTISGEIVTEAIHDFCKVNLGLSESNIELFKKALAGRYLGNVGPQVEYGTEFTANRWQKYIDCVGSKR